MPILTAAFAVLATLLLLACGFSVVADALESERVGWQTRATRNGLLPLIPILAWNVGLTSSLPPAFTDDSAVPAAIAFVEAAGRVFVFAAAALLVIDLDDRPGRAGVALLVLGTLAYFGSWIPALIDPTPSWLWLGSYALPAVWLIGLGLIGRSRGYIAGALVFVCAHVTHGVLVLAT